MTGDSAVPTRDVTARFEAALAVMNTERYALRLYVAGESPQARAAVRNARRICDDYLAGRVDLELVDIHEDPEAARDDMVLATPVLVRRLPQPLRGVVGDLSETEKVLVGLAIVPRG
jgi:circadian clock protein KaiB